MGEQLKLTEHTSALSTAERERFEDWDKGDGGHEELLRTIENLVIEREKAAFQWRLETRVFPDVFPSGPSHEGRDLGPRFVSLLRQMESLATDLDRDMANIHMSWPSVARQARTRLREVLGSGEVS